MLTETTDTAFKIGDTVVVSATTQSGRIIAFEGGRWKVQLDSGATLLKEAKEIQRRQVLMG